MKNKVAFLIPLLLALTACGSEVNNLVFGGVDKSGTWMDNYYTKWDEKYSVARESSTLRELDDNDMIFTSYRDENFSAIDPYYNEYKFGVIYEDNQNYYGNIHKLNKKNEVFKNNFTSKLFDGIMECGGRYEAARIQINESGFAVDFGAKCRNFDYFALQFKSSFDFKQHHPEASCSDITLYISFYKQDNESYICETFYYSLDVPTNGNDGHLGMSDYVFFGFTLASMKMNNVCGMSIQYTLNSNDKYDIDEMPHALLLYEVFLPNSTWVN